MSTILAVAGSARRKGNSDRLLERAIEGVRATDPEAEVETIYPQKLAVTPCRACDGCFKTGRCVVLDQAQDLYTRFETCDHLIVASPIYFTSVPGVLKVLIDRFQCYWARRELLHDPPKPRRTGMFLCVSALDRERYFEAARTVVRTWMMEIGMRCAVERFYPGLDGRRAVLERPDYLDDAFRAGSQLMQAGTDLSAPSR